jgi:hypothetical protein
LKALANDSPGLLQPWVDNREEIANPEGVRRRRTLSGFFVFSLESQGCRFAPTTGLELANAFGVICYQIQLHYRLLSLHKIVI